MSTTVRDVAAEAGVSPSTVSRVLRGTVSVSAEKRRAVLEAVAKLGFHPNALARALKTRRTHVIALIIPDITNPYYAEIARGVEDCTWSKGYVTIVANTANDPSREDAYLRVLQENRVDGVVIAVAGSGGPHLKAFMAGVPVVTVGRELGGGLRTDAVVVDNVAGMRAATEYLLSLGHRDIAFIGGNPAVSSSHARLLGYKQALEAAGIPVRGEWVLPGDFSIASGASAVERLRQDRMPTAIVCANDLSAIGAMRALKQRGLRIPSDISVVGFDDIPIATEVEPPLTTVAQPVRQMGEKAVGLLLDRTEGRRKRAKRVVLAAQLVVRESTGERK